MSTFTRLSFPRISPKAWEHPADAAALGAFAAIPGAKDLVSRIVGSTVERSLRLSALAGAARVSDGQFPEVHRLLAEAARILDLSPLPEAYVRFGTEPVASTVGVRKPFIVLSSAALDFWDEEELLAVLGHEVGHILSGHAAYKTLLSVLVQAQGALAGGLLGQAAFGALLSGLREWDRKSELSADRAALLVAQDPRVVYRALMKTAAGPRAASLDLNEFFGQARDYDAAKEGLDSLWKLLDLLGQTHPFPTLRMLGLQEWELGGSYEAALKGRYPRRDAEGPFDPLAAFEAAKAAYARDFASSEDPLSQAAGAAMEGLGRLAKGAEAALKGGAARAAGFPDLGNLGNFADLGAAAERLFKSRPSAGPADAASDSRQDEGPGPRVEDLLDELFRKE